ncbi:MAG: hypothetical protein HC867_00745 [Bacteroidia bacterium]|nr:hypothetical protein [Bacteroidia bacterium]
MKKITFLAMLFIAVSATGFAQKGSAQMIVAAEAGIPVGDFADLSAFGMGGSVKVLLGVSPNGAFTLTSGALFFGGKKEVEEILGNTTMTIIPFLAGYRHNFNGFYLEPQAGYGIYRTMIQSFPSDSESAFTWAMGMGYAIKAFDVCARFQSGMKNGASTNMIAVRIGYNFSLKGGNKK